MTTASSALTFTVSPHDHGARVDKFLAGAYSSVSRTGIQRFIVDGCVSCVRSGSTFPVPSTSFMVAMDDVLFLLLPVASAFFTPKDTPKPLDILYEDAHLAVVMKPAGLVVHHGAGTTQSTLVDSLRVHFGDELSTLGGQERPGIVHRLDKDTSGLLVIAKTDKAHRALGRLFENHAINRSYRAVVYGVPSPMAHTLKYSLARDERHRIRMAVSRRDTARVAITHYRVLQSAFGLSLLDCRLETGRTHQIRVHLSHYGFPLVGDGIYGGNVQASLHRVDAQVRSMVASFPRQALHAYALGFHHPVSGDYLSFTTPEPLDLSTFYHDLGFFLDLA